MNVFYTIPMRNIIEKSGDTDSNTALLGAKRYATEDGYFGVVLFDETFR